MAEKKQAPAPVEVFAANLELVRISKYTLRYRMVVDASSQAPPVNVHHFEVPRSFGPDDVDFNMDFIGREDLPKGNRTMLNKQAKFRKYMNLKLSVTIEG